MTATHIIKLSSEEPIETESLKSVLSIISDQASHADDLEYVIEIVREDFCAIPKDVTAEILDALEQREIANEQDKFNHGETNESNFDAHIEMAETKFFWWRTRSWHGKGVKILEAAE
jgi:hypothetical protein